MCPIKKAMPDPSRSGHWDASDGDAARDSRGALVVVFAVGCSGTGGDLLASSDIRYALSPVCPATNRHPTPPRGPIATEELDLAFSQFWRGRFLPRRVL